jgi:transcription elongation factor Elf1
MIQLEKYHGTKSRHTCPGCNSRNCFVRYVDENGEYISDDCGRCNRESKCGYEYKPKQFFADNPSLKSAKTKKRGTPNYAFVVKNGSQVEYKRAAATKPDYIAPEHLAPTIGHYDRNAFVQFLFDLFPDCSEEIQAVLKMYFVGTYEDYTCFPSIDRLNRICRAKLIKFNPATGKRLKGDYDTSSLVRKLKLKEDFNYKQIFFGEHLLRREAVKPVAIVESEKTAIIASLCMPQFVWLATGSKQWLKVERLQRFDNRQIILYPDADGFDQWQAVALDAQRQGLNVKTSRLIESFATDQQKRNQYDLADYLIEQQTEINEINEFIDRYNFAVDKTQACTTLPRELKTILEETISIIEINGNLSRTEAERVATAPESMRRIIPSL